MMVNHWVGVSAKILLRPSMGLFKWKCKPNLHSGDEWAWTEAAIETIYFQFRQVDSEDNLH